MLHLGQYSHMPLHNPDMPPFYPHNIIPTYPLSELQSILHIEVNEHGFLIPDYSRDSTTRLTILHYKRDLDLHSSWSP